MLGLGRASEYAGWWSTVDNTRRVGTASTNSSVAYTAYNSTTTSDTYFKFGSTSEFASTDNSYIMTDTSQSYMTFGTGDFCVEFWMYFTTTSGHSASSDLWANDVSYGLGCRLAEKNSTNPFANYISIFSRNQADGDYWTLPSGNWQANTWNFVVIQRKSNQVAAWANGDPMIYSGFTDRSLNNENFNANGQVAWGYGGASSAGAGPIYLDEICVSNAYRYTNQAAAIPVPTAAFTVDSYTTQLLHMDGTNGGTTFVNATS